MKPGTKSHAAGFLAIVTIAVLLAAIMVPGLGPTPGLAQVVPTPGVAGIQAASMLSVPVPATLAAGAILNGLPFAAGQSITIIALPAGFSLPLQPGGAMLSAGTVIMIAGGPELGQIVLAGPTAVNVGAGLQAAMPLGSTVTATLLTGASAGTMNLPAGTQILVTGIPQGMMFAQGPGIMAFPPGTTITVFGRPDLGQLTLTTAATADLNEGASMFSGVPSLRAHGTLLAGTTLGGAPFSAGEQIDILSLPAGFILPTDGGVTLPPGAVVGISSRPDLGPITLMAPTNIDVEFSVALPGAAAPSVSMLLAPVSGSLAAALTAGTVQWPSGMRVEILGAPPGFSLTGRTGIVTLPAGAIIRFPDRPEYAPIALDVPVRVDLSSAVPAAAAPAAAVPAAPQPALQPVPEAPLAPAAPLEAPPMVEAAPMWPAFFTLSSPVVGLSVAPFMAADIEFSSEQLILIIGLPMDVLLEPGAIVVLPIDTAIQIPDWPELGDIYLNGEAEITVLE